MKKILLLLNILVLFSCAPKKISIGMKSAFLTKEMNELENYISKESIADLNVSSVKAGWHIEHVLLTVTKIYTRMESSNPGKYKNRPNLVRMMMFHSNQIPRGRANAPEMVIPKEKITQETLYESYAMAKTMLLKFDDLDDNAYFKHPAAGYLNRDDAKRFIKIHTEHHLKIIRDILKINN